MSNTYAEMANRLLAVTGELVDDELVEAAHVLREVSIELDAVDERFRAATSEFKRLLMERL